MKENKLIAEFMSMEDYQEMGEYVTPNYHTSWDWLMPVVEKCYHNGSDENEVGDITHALLDCDINHTYRSVAEFIKQYNK
jgi:hypothetical protein